LVLFFKKEHSSLIPSLVCFGNLTLDDIVQPDGTMRERCIGGDALYGVLGARLFESRAEMVAPVGHDFPQGIRDRIRKAGLSGEGLRERPCPTLHTRFVYHTHDHRTVTLLSDADDFEILSPNVDDVPEPYWQANAFMILAMTLQAQRALIPACRARSAALIALDPQEEYIAGNEAAVLDLVAQTDIFLPSLAEVRLLLGHEDASRAAKQFAALGPRIVVIKMGERGCLVHDAEDSSVFVQPAFPSTPVDTTGSGDAFCCAFLASLAAAPARLHQAAAAGTVAASFALAGYGAEALFLATTAQAFARRAGLSPPITVRPGQPAR